ncbi:MAG: hypothetical protein K2X29_02670 [Candidatus Obscuribacterales bacterium]|nr:hypothetical protein [Candidatus Obscuribacterales bacterium]
MNRILKIAIALVFATGLSQQVVSAGDWTESIKVNFALDDKQWELGWSNKSETIYIMEFVPKGQTVENWKELITFEFYPGLQKKANCSQFTNGFLRNLRINEPNVKVSNYVDKPDNVIVEWVLNGSAKNADQDELDRCIFGKQGLHMLHYVKKTKALTPGERTKWLKFLESATLIDSK